MTNITLVFRPEVRSRTTLRLTLAVRLGLAMLLSACSDSGRSPTSASGLPSVSPSPSPSPLPSPPGATYTLSGMVFEVAPQGQVPIEGVEVYCDSCGSPQGHTFTYTDSDGTYSFSWTSVGPNPLYVTKSGYENRRPDRHVAG